MSMETYVPVMTRLLKFREDNKAKKIFIEKEVIVSWEKEAAYVKVTVYLDGEKVAQAHAMAPVLGEEKEFEKAETSAIGRALVDLGYLADDGTDDKTEKKSSKKSKGGGLGGKKKSKKKDDDAEEEDDDEDEEESDDEEEESEDDDDEDEDEEEESEDDEEEEEEKSSKKSASSASPSAKLNGVMAKYGLKK